MNPVVRHDDGRLERLRERIAKAGFDALLLTSPAGRRHVRARTTVGESAVVLTATGLIVHVADVDRPTAMMNGLRVAGMTEGVVGTDVDPSWELFNQVSSVGTTLRPATDLVFTELAAGADAEADAVTAASELAVVGYTAVMDHLRVGMSVRDLSANVDRSIRRAGGRLGWYDGLGSTAGAAGTDLVTVRGHDPDTARLSATTPVRYVLHPLLDGVAGYAAATALLGKAGPGLRAVGEAAATATAALLAALRPGAPLREGYEAFGRDVGRYPAASAIVTLRGGVAGPALPRDSRVLAEAGMVLGVRTAVADPAHGTVELGATVGLVGSCAEPLTDTPLRLVELY